MDPAKNRRVYGVPVFPGPASSGSSPSVQGERPPTAPRPSLPDSNATPSAVEVGQNGSTAPGGGANNSGGTMHWKLRHIDFTPNLVKGKKDDEFERFP